jgi:hypothetical protein
MSKTPSKPAGGKAISTLGQPLKLPPMPAPGATTLDLDAGRRDAADRAKAGLGEASPKGPLGQKK